MYNKGLTPKGKTEPLIIGSIVHMLLDLHTQGKLHITHFQHLEAAMRRMYKFNAEPEIISTSQEVIRLLRGYFDYWDENTLQIISPELHLVNTYTEPQTGTEFELYSRVDALAIDEDDRPARLERKTTSRADSKYLAGTKLGLQACIAHWLIDDLMPQHKIKGTYYDMMVKTKIAQYYRSYIRLPRWKLDKSKETVYGIIRSIVQGDLYPSVDCFDYGRECSYALLCREETSGTPESLQRGINDFFEPRKEVMEREQDVFMEMLQEVL